MQKIHLHRIDTTKIESNVAKRLVKNGCVSCFKLYVFAKSALSGSIYRNNYANIANELGISVNNLTKQVFRLKKIGMLRLSKCKDYYIVTGLRYFHQFCEDSMRIRSFQVTIPKGFMSWDNSKIKIFLYACVVTNLSKLAYKPSSKNFKSDLKGKYFSTLKMNKGIRKKHMDNYSVMSGSFLAEQLDICLSQACKILQKAEDFNFVSLKKIEIVHKIKLSKEEIGDYNFNGYYNEKKGIIVESLPTLVLPLLEYSKRSHSYSAEFMESYTKIKRGVKALKNNMKN